MTVPKRCFIKFFTVVPNPLITWCKLPNIVLNSEECIASFIIFGRTIEASKIKIVVGFVVPMFFRPRIFIPLTCCKNAAFISKQLCNVLITFTIMVPGTIIIAISVFYCGNHLITIQVISIWGVFLLSSGGFIALLLGGANAQWEEGLHDGISIGIIVDVVVIG